VRLLHSKYIPDDVWSGIESVPYSDRGGKLKVDSYLGRALGACDDDLGGGAAEMRGFDS